MAAKPIFVGGTGSHAGKSWVTTALCRYLYRMGYRVAPFKAQNMSNNSMACAGGGEIGRAQAAQAEACGLEPDTDMNPILLKPTGGFGSQVVVNGRPWRNLKAAEYYEHFDFLLQHVLTAYSRLAEKVEFIVIEGAGSISELNLRHHDLVNMGLALRLNAPAMLVADIDRGGVFASVIGTFQVLEPDERSLVRSFLINRFRGDRRLFDDGVRILEEKTGRPCLGVFPFVEDIYLDPEDSVTLEEHSLRISEGIRAAIIQFPHISNFTDFRLLPSSRYLTEPSNERFDIIFLPGSKNTIEDLVWLRSKGFEPWLRKKLESGTKVVGLCGGFQMLGERIVDPHGVESGSGSIRGLGLLPVETYLAQEKTTRKISAKTLSGIPFEGYEIHMGITKHLAASPPFAVYEDGTDEGIRTANVIGTYIHGALENQAVLEDILGVTLPNNSNASKESNYDRLAVWFDENVDHDVFTKSYIQR